MILSPVKLFAHGPAAFGAYLGFLIALQLILLPTFPPGLNTPGIDPIEEYFIKFFAGWVFRPDFLQNVLFVVILVAALLLTATLCSRGTNLAIMGGLFFLGTFFFLYFAGKYAQPFMNANLPSIGFTLLVNALILVAAAIGWSTVLNRKYNPKAALPPDQWTTIETTCPRCGAKFKSNPKFCAYCSTTLRE